MVSTRNVLLCVIVTILIIFIVQLVAFKPRSSLISEEKENNYKIEFGELHKEEVKNNQDFKQIRDDEINQKPTEYPIPKPSKNKSFKIGVIPIPGAKVGKLPQHSHIVFTSLNLPTFGDYKYWPNMGYYISIFGFGYRSGSKDEYTFAQYREDMAFSHDLLEFGKSIKKDFDFIFIAPIGVQFDDTFANNLYEFINSAIQEVPQYCILQTYMSKKEREKNKIYGKDYKLKVNWPEYSYKQMGGMVITSEIFSRMPEFFRTTHYLNRFDVIIQHYCEVADDPILVSPFNLFQLPHGAFN